MDRKPIVAGQFYPADKEQLQNDIAHCFQHQLGPGILSEEKTSESLIAAVVPHAGYVYSGMVAAHVYHRIATTQAKTDVFVILGPNHRGMGATIALYPDGHWSTPLGEVEIDRTLAQRLLADPLIEADKSAHTFEHSLEVQLPFLQTVAKDFTIVPITLMDQRLTTAKSLGQLLGKVVEEENRRITLLASSDFSHYVSAKKAHEDDNQAIEKILALEAEDFYQLIVKNQISICGYGPIMAIMTAAVQIGVKKRELLKYATSGDVQPMNQVVGYAAITLSK